MFEATVSLVQVTCGACQIVFAVPQDFYDRRRNDHRNWTCPEGHVRCFSGQSDLEKAKAERDQAKVEAERQRIAAVDARCEAQGQRLKAERLEKKLKRVRNGVCPECQRSFQNVRRHMTSKHPGCVARSR